MNPESKKPEAGAHPYPEARTIKDLPRNLQPREQLERVGPEGVEDDVLLAILLRTGMRGKNVGDLARELLKKSGGLPDLSRFSLQELCTIKSMGRVKALTLIAAFELGRRAREARGEDAPALRSPGEVARMMRGRADSPVERFWILPLNKKNRMITREPALLTSGIVDASLIHPREVFAVAVRTMSCGVILVHNHPSGDPTPSAEDVRVTRNLIDAGRVMDIEVIDHVVMGREGHPEHPAGFFSFRESGLVDFQTPSPA